MNLKDDKQQKIQMELDFSSAPTGEAREAGREGPEASGATSGTENPASTNRLMEAVCERENLKAALRQVKANKGSPGHTRSRRTYWSFNICPATLRCSEARKRQKVDCGGSRRIFRMPVNIGSRSRKRRWFSRANPTYNASTMANTNWYTGIARVSRLMVSVSSTSRWNPSFSSMVAMGSRPPYAVKWRPVKS